MHFKLIINLLGLLLLPSLSCQDTKPSKPQQAAPAPSTASTPEPSAAPAAKPAPKAEVKKFIQKGVEVELEEDDEPLEGEDVVEIK